MSDSTIAKDIDLRPLRAVSGRWAWRRFADALARHGIRACGGAVIVAVTLILFYLVYMVSPLFRAAQLERLASYGPVPGQTLYLGLEERADMAVRITARGRAVFFHTKTGETVAEHGLGIPRNARIQSLSVVDAGGGLLALGLDDGSVRFVRYRYEETFPNDRRTITPVIEHPLETSLEIADRAIGLLAASMDEERVVIAARAGPRRLVIAAYTRGGGLLELDTTGVESAGRSVVELTEPVSHAVLAPGGRRLYVIDAAGQLALYDVDDAGNARLRDHKHAVPSGTSVTAVSLLLGGISVLVGDSTGRVSQWFPVRTPDHGLTLELVRTFEVHETPVTALAPEQRRKGFLSGARDGGVSVAYTTSSRVLTSGAVSQRALRHLAVAPRGDALVAEDGDGVLHFWRIDNEYPEISWSGLWEEVWYENHEQPKYIWQSSAATTDFEPKFSLVPLTFGTLKAAFYCMLLAVPLGIMGAIYTAYFAAPPVRGAVKPAIELMEALPTVILGFLAGLWLAPFVEAHIPGVFAVFVIVPAGVMGFSWLWSRAPARVRYRLPDGWHVFALVPVVVLLVWVSIALSRPLEVQFFGGDMRGWLFNEMGVGFDQRNAIIVGLAMGFAVIPTIFSITEDAVFGVPKHLTDGSLALGATPWQSLVRVVLPTASPGIFSAVMIGLGRAVGETMIVLMATGNTPVMDMSVFQGMRTLSANIAVEMPESEVGSTHFRVLFLCSLVLFAFTLVLNTAAELVRQRLRRTYAEI